MIGILTDLKKRVTQNAINIPGWRTKRKIVVIESDDWGSIRMPSVEVYSKFMERGFEIAGSIYNRLDTLESNNDLQLLFGILKSHMDSRGNPPVITANIVVGNPDFDKIQQSDFTDYFYEASTETLKKYPERHNVESLWKQGNAEHIFHPQFHGREHVNIIRWMEALRKRSPEIMFTFSNGTTFSGDGDYNFMEVLDFNTPGDLVRMKKSLAEGLDLFENIFGFRSKSFIPPCYVWNSDIEYVLKEKGVRYLQGLVIQSLPTGSFGNYRKKYHFLGSRNNLGQYYLVRNCFFEPSLSKSNDPSGECLKRIDIAFRWNKPAIISSHRINYIGTLDENNRTMNLRHLDNLLGRIINLWPEVEFMTSDQLGELIESGG